MEQNDFDKLASELSQQGDGGTQQTQQAPQQETITLPNGQSFTGTPEQVAQIRSLQATQPDAPRPGQQQAPSFDVESWAVNLAKGDKAAVAQFDETFHGMPKGVTLGDGLRNIEQYVLNLRKELDGLQFQGEDPAVLSQAQRMVEERRVASMKDAIALAKAQGAGNQQQTPPAVAQPTRQTAPPQPWSPPPVDAGGQPGSYSDPGLDTIRQKTENLSPNEIEQLIAKMEQGQR